MFLFCHDVYRDTSLPRICQVTCQISVISNFEKLGYHMMTGSSVPVFAKRGHKRRKHHITIRNTDLSMCRDLCLPDFFKKTMMHEADLFVVAKRIRLSSQAEVRRAAASTRFLNGDRMKKLEEIRITLARLMTEDFHNGACRCLP